MDEEDIQQKGDWVDFTTTVAKAEELLDIRFYLFKDEATNSTKIRTWEYSVPGTVASLVRIIQPTTMFGRFKSLPETLRSHHSSRLVEYGEDNENNPGLCATVNTPICLRKLYGLENCTAEARGGNVLGVSGYLEQNAQYDDVQALLGKYAPYAAGTDLSVKLIDGASNVQESGANSVGANLDMQYAIALSYNTRVVLYSTGGRGGFVPIQDEGEEMVVNSNEPYLMQLRYLVGLPDDQLPTVITTSYGEPEAIVPGKYAAVACDMFAQLGARGVSIIFASGDFGVGSACWASDWANTARFDSTEDRDPERAVDFSSGGFSDMFRRPAYQEELVSKYLTKLGDQWMQYHNSKGRGFLDIATQGVSYPIYNQGKVIQTGGTR